MPFVAESSNVADQPALSETIPVEVEPSNNGNENGELVDNQKESVSDKVVVAEESIQAEQNGHAAETVLAESSVETNQNVAHSIPVTAVSNLQEDAETNQNVARSIPVEDAPKKSFASVVSYCPSFY